MSGTTAGGRGKVADRAQNQRWAWRQRTEQHTASRRALAGMRLSHHAHTLVTLGRPLS